MSFLGNGFKWGLFKYGIIFVIDVVEYTGVGDHEAAVDPAAIFLSLFHKACDGVGLVVDIEYTETTAWLDRCHGDNGMGIFAMIFQKPGNVDITYSIAVGEHERLVTNIFLDAFDPGTGLCVEAGIDQGDLPGFGDVVMYGHPVVVGEVEGDI